MKRIIRSLSDMMSELVRAPWPKKRTPRMKVPSVTPHAAKMISGPGARVALGEDATRIGDAHGLHAFLLTVFRRHQPALHPTVQAPHGRGGEHPFGCAADPHDGMDVGAADGGRDAGREVAVGDQPDARPGAADLLDQLLVPRTVEHDHDEVLHLAAETFGDDLEILLRASRRGAPRPWPPGRR